VRSVKGVFVVLVLGAALAFGVSACGGSSTSTVTTTQSQAPTTPTTTATTTPTTTTATSTSSTTTATTTAAGPGSCGPNQAFSQVSNSCVDINPSGNPCPKGQVPMADRPVCVSKND
jgi:ABC-type transport system substrate-binding protein